MENKIISEAKIEIIHTEKGVSVKIYSDTPLPKDGESGNLSQEIAMIAMAHIRKEMEAVMGKNKVHLVKTEH